MPWKKGHCRFFTRGIHIIESSKYSIITCLSISIWILKFYFLTNTHLCRLHQRRIKNNTGKSRTGLIATYLSRSLCLDSSSFNQVCIWKMSYQSLMIRREVTEQRWCSIGTPSLKWRSSRPVSQKNGFWSSGIPLFTSSRQHKWDVSQQIIWSDLKKNHSIFQNVNLRWESSLQG